MEDGATESLEFRYIHCTINHYSANQLMIQFHIQKHWSPAPPMLEEKEFFTCGGAPSQHMCRHSNTPSETCFTTISLWNHTKFGYVWHEPHYLACIYVLRDSKTNHYIAILHGKPPGQKLSRNTNISCLKCTVMYTLSLIHIWRCRRSTLCRSRWSPYH